MDISKELAEAKRKLEETIAQANQLAEQRQQLLQEALRLSGEVRVLEKLSKQDKPK